MGESDGGRIWPGNQIIKYFKVCTWTLDKSDAEDYAHTPDTFHTMRTPFVMEFTRSRYGRASSPFAFQLPAILDLVYGHASS